MRARVRVCARVDGGLGGGGGGRGVLWIGVRTVFISKCFITDD